MTQRLLEMPRTDLARLTRQAVSERLMSAARLAANNGQPITFLMLEQSTHYERGYIERTVGKLQSAGSWPWPIERDEA